MGEGIFFFETVFHCNPGRPKTYPVTQAYPILLLHIKYWDYKCDPMHLDISVERLNQDLSVVMHTYNFWGHSKRIKISMLPWTT